MKIILFLFIATFSLAASAQDEKAKLDSLNRFIDASVVNKNKAALDTLYAYDFVFTHFTGLVDSKTSWLKNVMDAKTNFIARTHDSVYVELHNDAAMITGKLTVQRKDGDKITAYALRYVRIFLKRNNRWQLVSHYSTAEVHLP